MANAAVENMFGYTVESLIGQTTEMLHVDKSTFLEFGKISEPILASDGIYQGEYQMKHKSGKIIYVENTVTPIKGKGTWELGVVSVVRDITEKKEAEIKLKEREEYLNVLMENASDAILACDANGRLEFYNKKLKDWLGGETPNENPEVWPEKYRWYNIETNQPLKKNEISLLCALTKGKVRNDRFIIKNEKSRFIESNGAALYDEENNKIGAVVVMRDVTERINKDVEISNAILEALDKERQAIASELHDNLTQTLSIASMNLKNLTLDEEELRKKKKFTVAQNYIQQAIDQSRKISHRIMPKSIDDFGIFVSLEELIEDLESAYDIDITFEYNKEMRIPKTIEVNAFRIIQEALNNSIKHANASEIKIMMNLIGRQLFVEVTDNGKGMENEEEISGIGLRTMKNRALKIGAELSIQSNKKGTLIKLTIPLA